VVRFDGDGCAPIITQDADDRAESLLLEHLDERQASDWRNLGHFDVVTVARNRYRVCRDGSEVRSLDDRGVYCLQPIDTVPKADTALAHKLWLEADEAGFLAAANKFAYPNEWDRARRRAACWEAPLRQGTLYLETVEDARAWAEAQNWDVTLSIDRHTDFIMYQWDVRTAPPEPTYEINGMVSDAHTVDLLRRVAMERNERHAAAFEAGVETERNRETLTQQELDYLSNLDCPMDVQVREGYCDAT